MNRTDEENDQLWHLLGRARQPVVSPFFSRKVVREVRSLQEKRGTGSVVLWLLRYWQIPAMGALALAVAGGAMLHHAPVRTSLLATIEATASAAPDLGVIGDLDELLDSEKNSVWLASDAE